MLHIQTVVVTDVSRPYRQRALPLRSVQQTGNYVYVYSLYSKSISATLHVVVVDMLLSTTVNKCVMRSRNIVNVTATWLC